MKYCPSPLKLFFWLVFVGLTASYNLFTAAAHGASSSVPICTSLDSCATTQSGDPLSDSEGSTSCAGSDRFDSDNGTSSASGTTPCPHPSPETITTGTRPNKGLTLATKDGDVPIATEDVYGSPAGSIPLSPSHTGRAGTGSSGSSHRSQRSYASPARAAAGGAGTRIPASSARRFDFVESDPSVFSTIEPIALPEAINITDADEPKLLPESHSLLPLSCIEEDGAFDFLREHDFKTSSTENVLVQEITAYGKKYVCLTLNLSHLLLYLFRQSIDPFERALPEPSVTASLTPTNELVFTIHPHTPSSYTRSLKSADCTKAEYAYSSRLLISGSYFLLSTEAKEAPADKKIIPQVQFNLALAPHTRISNLTYRLEKEGLSFRIHFMFALRERSLSGSGHRAGHKRPHQPATVDLEGVTKHLDTRRCTSASAPAE